MATVVIPFQSPGVAGFEEGNEYTQVEVFFGEKTPLTQRFKVAATVVAMPIYTVVGLNASNELVPATAGNCFGVMTCDCKGGDNVDVYREAYFNDLALCWPTGTDFDTYDKRKVAFIGSKSPGIYIGRNPTHGRVIPARTGIVTS